MAKETTLFVLAGFIGVAVAGSAGGLVPNASQSLPPAPADPLRILSLRATATGDVDRAGRPILACTLTVKNESDQNVMAYALAYSWLSTDTSTPSGTTFAASYASEWTHPVIRAGATISHTTRLAERPGTLRATIDLVLLADGRFYGPNRSRTLQEFQENLAATRSVEQHVLSILSEHGPQALRQYLERELADADRDRRLLNPQMKGLTTASASYRP
jgi:hypothetical protein